MKQVIAVLMGISFYSCSIAQKIDMINISSIPPSVDFLSDKYHNADYVRTNYEFLMSIKEKNKIQELISIKQSIKKELLYSIDKREMGNCRIVIDFISASRIVESIVIHKSYTMSFDEPYSQVKIYKFDSQFLCYLQNQFPSIIQVKHNHINCME